LKITSLVSEFDGSNNNLFFFKVNCSLEDFRDDLSDPVGVLSRFIVGSFLGESDVNRARAHSLDLALLGLMREEQFSLNRLLDVNEGKLFDSLDLASIALGHIDSSDDSFYLDLAFLAVI